MKTLLRSCFLADVADVEALLTGNLHALIESGMGFETVEDEALWETIREFFRAHNHLPRAQTLRDHFDQNGQKQVVDRLEQLIPLPSKTRGDFLTHLEDKVRERKTRQVQELAKDMAQIAAKGFEIKDAKGKVTRLEGPIEAIRYMLDKSHDLVAPTNTTRLSGNLMTEGERFLQRYDQIRSDPRFGLGQFTGIAQIDEALKGAKKGELWIHAGFTGHMKSSFALQWAYIQAVYYGYSSVYFSLEMPLEQVNNMIYVMHSAHEDFRDIRKQLSIPGLGLDYSKVKYGKLDPNEELFLREYVVPDINKTATVPHDGPHSLDSSAYGDLLVEVPDPDKDEVKVPDLRHRAELIYSKNPFHTIFVDHAGLLYSRTRYSNTTERLNEVLRDLKKMAMSFNRGLGMAVVGLFQISREGFRAAEKNGGKYNLTHLSYASEAEKSGDIITASWLGEDVKKLGRLIIQNLKSRDEAGFDRVPVRIEFPCRRLLTDRTPIEELDEKVRAAQAQAMPPQQGYSKRGGAASAVAATVAAPVPLNIEWANE